MPEVDRHVAATEAGEVAEEAHAGESGPPVALRAPRGCGADGRATRRSVAEAAPEVPMREWCVADAENAAKRTCERSGELSLPHREAALYRPRGQNLKLGLSVRLCRGSWSQERRPVTAAAPPEPPVRPQPVTPRALIASLTSVARVSAPVTPSRPKPQRACRRSRRPGRRRSRRDVDCDPVVRVAGRCRPARRATAQPPRPSSNDVVGRACRAVLILTSSTNTPRPVRRRRPARR